MWEYTGLEMILLRSNISFLLFKKYLKQSKKNEEKI